MVPAQSGRLALAALLGICVLGALCWWLCQREGEQVVDVLTAPNGKFKVVITKTREHWPYGVEGRVYLADTAGEQRTFAVSYYVDDLGELMSYFRWDTDAQAFEYRGKASGAVLLRRD